MKDTGTGVKMTRHFKNFINNLRAARRAEVNGSSVDSEQLSQADTGNLITDFFKDDNEVYKKLLNKKWRKDA